MTTGPVREFYQGDRLLGEGELIGGRKHGPWRNWHRNGQLKAEGSFEHGEFAGE